MSPLTETITAVLMRSLWQDAVVALALWIALRVSRRRSPNLRYLLSCTALATMVLWPVLSSVDTAPLRSTTPASHASRAVPPIDVSSIVGDGWLSSASPADVPANVTASIERWALPFWIAGVVLFSIRAFAGGAHAVVLARRSTPADAALLAQIAAVAQRMGITRRVRAAISERTLGAATLGVWHPLILVPSAALIGLTAQQLEAVLAHELAHIRRHDYVVNVVQVLVETLGFHHPAIWWASKQISAERELCCDDLALRGHGDPLSYAQALTALACMTAAVPRPALGAATGSLLHRVQRMLGATGEVRPLFPWSVLLSLALIVAAGAIHPEWIRTHAIAEEARLSGFVYDPLGGLVAGIPISVESGPFQRSYFDKTTTDRSGHFLFEHLPSGSFVLTAPQTEFVRPLRINLEDGASVEQDIHMQIDTLAGEITVCATCPPESDSYQLPASLLEEFRRDREAAAANPIQGVAPLGGWEFDRPRVYPYPPFLAPSLEGTAVVEGHIGSDGSPLGLHVVSSAHDDLSAAALAIVQEQRWEPARVQGVAIDVPLRMRVRFMRTRQ